MSQIYYAKTKLPNGLQPTVKEHLEAVSTLAEKYGAEFENSAVTKIAGLYHDFGKYSSRFQKVLEGTYTHADHALPGAAVLYPFAEKNTPYKSIADWACRPSRGGVN
jgi:CRISPR-associated endonuclease/helicase Cas3